MILIDTRAGSKDLVTIPPLDSMSTLCKLDSADVCFSGNGPSGPILIGIEVKSFFDLISSLSSGRLQAEQIPKMIGDPSKNIPAAYDVNWLLYYGDYQSNPETGTLQIRRKNKGIKGGVHWEDYRIGNRPIPYGYISSFLCSPSFTNTGILSHRVINIQEAAAWIAVLYRTWQKPYHAHKSMRTFNKASGINLQPGIDARTQARAVTANTLPGLGYEKALAAANHFGSIREMINADSDTWSEIPVTSASGRVARIGKVIGKAIEEHVK